MIIKSLSRRSNGSQLINYVLRYVIDDKKNKEKTRDQKNISPLIIRHNIRSRSIKGYIKEFEENESFRLYKRKDSVKLFHTVLSLSSNDRGVVTDSMLKDVAKKYIALRGENNLYVGAPHHDKDHIHLHLVVSGTQLNGRSSRISKQEFKHIKLALERYQKEKYPELIHSVVQHEKGKQKTKEEIVQTLKVERQTNKQTLATSLDDIYDNAHSLEEFLSHLQAQGHEPYYRNGKLQGVKFDGDKKIRFSRLGFTDEKLQSFTPEKTSEETSLAELQTIRQGKISHNRIIEASQDELDQPMQETEVDPALDELQSIRSNTRKEQSRTVSIDTCERSNDSDTSNMSQENDNASTSVDYELSP